MAIDNTQDTYKYPIVSVQELKVFDLLEHPVWAFNVSKRRMAWANGAAVDLWAAKFLQELQDRNFDDMSDSTVTRLKDYQTNRFSKGEKVHDQWTFYPNGVAKTVQATFSGITLVGTNDFIMLVEGIYMLEIFDKDALRGVEMLRHLPISVTQFDIDGNVMYQNPEAMETFGSPCSAKKNENQVCNEEVEKTPDILTRFVDQSLGKQVFKQVQAGQTVSVEANQFTSNGAQWSALKLRRAKDPVTSQQVILYSARDITDIVTAKKEKEVCSKKSEFFAIMAHEVRTPLHQVTGFIDLLSQTELDLEQQSFIKLLQTSAVGLMAVINDVLDYSKLEAGKMKFESIPFEPRSVLEASMDTVRQSYDYKKLTLKLELDKGIPCRINGDSNRLRQVLLNLLTNALKFTAVGGVEIKVRQHCPSDQEPVTEDASPECDRHRGVLEFSVHDTGMGISEENLQHIFQEYQQANASIARNFGGTGLGLSICKKLVQNMGGVIGVNSQLDKGSTFWFTLPYETPLEEEMEESKPKEQVPVTPLGGLKVLVAEDNLVNQKLMASILKRTGHSAKIVDNGQQAVDEIQRGETDYDLILMDLQMPVMDGLEATQSLRRMGYTDIPIYAVTASVQRTDFAELGFNDWIGKPISMKTFKEKLQRLQQCLSFIQ